MFSPTLRRKSAAIVLGLIAAFLAILILSFCAERPARATETAMALSVMSRHYADLVREELGVAVSACDVSIETGTQAPLMLRADFLWVELPEKPGLHLGLRWSLKGRGTYAEGVLVRELADATASQAPLMRELVHRDLFRSIRPHLRC